MFSIYFLILKESLHLVHIAVCDRDSLLMTCLFLKHNKINTGFNFSQYMEKTLVKGF